MRARQPTGYSEMCIYFPECFTTPSERDRKPITEGHSFDGKFVASCVNDGLSFMHRDMGISATLNTKTPVELVANNYDFIYANVAEPFRKAVGESLDAAEDKLKELRRLFALKPKPFYGFSPLLVKRKASYPDEILTYEFLASPINTKYDRLLAIIGGFTLHGLEARMPPAEREDLIQLRNLEKTTRFGVRGEEEESYLGPHYARGESLPQVLDNLILICREYPKFEVAGLFEPLETS